MRFGVPFWLHFGAPNGPFWESFFGLFLDVAPRAPQEPPKRRQEAPKGAPRDPKRRPGRPQERPKRPRERPKRSPRGFKRPQEEPKGKRKRKEIGPKQLSEQHLFKNVNFIELVQKERSLMMFNESELCGLCGLCGLLFATASVSCSALSVSCCSVCFGCLWRLLLTYGRCSRPWACFVDIIRCSRPWACFLELIRRFPFSAAQVFGVACASFLSIFGSKN